jgi:hypothetical protein
MTMASLAIKSGFMMKRNEQGVWHKKFICSVPHTFLYYFDSETSESPRGVIDLELYTNISVEDNVLKLGTNAVDEEKLRFAFQCHNQKLKSHPFLFSFSATSDTFSSRTPTETF